MWDNRKIKSCKLNNIDFTSFCWHERPHFQIPDSVSEIIKKVNKQV